MKKLFFDLFLSTGLIYLLAANPSNTTPQPPFTNQNQQSTTQQNFTTQVPDERFHRRPPSSGIIFVPMPPPEFRIPVKLSAQSLDIRITEGVAKVKVTQTFKNESNTRLEGMYIFPMPEQSVISDFSMFDGETRLIGKVLNKDDARKIYEDIVRKQRDPALLEYLGQGMFQARIFPIEPRSEKKLELTYSQLLKSENHAYRFACNLLPDQIITSETRININASIRTNSDVSNVYSPTHNIRTEAISSREVKINLQQDEGKKGRSKDFVLYYTVSGDAIASNLISFRPISDEDGYFLVAITPNIHNAGAKSQPKDVIFVLDRSGSMAGDKIVQAREALKFCLRSLNPNDRYGLIEFSDDVHVAKSGLSAVNSQTIDDAVYLVDKINASGGTNINEALLKALSVKSKKDGRGTYIIFLTDGLPTVGVENPAKIIANVTKANDIDARMFCFGVGYDVDTYLLDKLSDENGGSSNYVKPDENIETEVGKFFAKINEPLMQDVVLTFDGVSVYDVYPKKLPDIFKGSQITVVGRYRKSGRADVTLSGRIGDVKKHFSYTVNFASVDRENDFAGGLWARRKVAYLLDEIRLNGENKELIDEIVRLSKQFGIVNQYTSFLITEKEEVAHQRLGSSFDRRKYDANSGGYAPVASDEAAGMVRASKSVQSMKLTNQVANDEVSIQQEYKSVAGRFFIRKDGVWIDRAYDANKNYTKKSISFGSDDYFSLIEKNKKYLEILRIGEKIIFVDGNTCYEIK